MAISEKKKITDKRHQEKLDRMVIQPYKDEGQTIRQAATDAGQSLQGYILQACRERMQRDAASPQSLRQDSQPAELTPERPAEPAPD